MPRNWLVALIGLAAAPALGHGIHGTFSPASPTWFRGAPADDGEIRLDCALDLTHWQAEWESPYAIYGLEVTNDQPIEIWTDQDGTQYDPVLYLYCDGFDASHPERGAIVFDDDGGPGSMAMIGSQDLVRLTPGRVYWLMVAWYDSLDEGNYLIHLGENIRLCAVACLPTTWSTVKARYQ